MYPLSQTGPDPYQDVILAVANIGILLTADISAFIETIILAVADKSNYKHLSSHIFSFSSYFY